MNTVRRDFLKGIAAVPFLGYFAFAFKENINKEISAKSKNLYETLKIRQLDAPGAKLLPPTGNDGNRLRIGLVGNGWRGEQLLKSLGYVHPEFIKQNTVDGKFTKRLQDFLDQEDLNIEFAGVCDTFDVRVQRGVEISTGGLGPGGKTNTSAPAKVFPSYREMVDSDEIDAILIATPDHTHTQIAIAAAKAGKHVYLEKPMTHSIEEAVELKKVIKSTGVVFQLGHENRQQMSFKIARELYQKGVLGDVSIVQTFTNRNTVFGAWIRDDAFDHKLGNRDNIDWKEFLAGAPWHEFDRKRYFSWQRYSDYGTSVTGNDFSHRYDCVNQILELGIPETVVALGGQHYYKTHGDMPDVLSAVFHYPKRKLTMTYDCSLKNSIYRQSKILGSEASMDVDRAIMLYKDGNSERYADIQANPSDPMYYYEPNTGIDAISSATSQAYIKGGYGPTYIDGKVIDATLLHLKEWIDAIRGHGKTSCNIDVGFEEAVTFNLANLAYVNKKPVIWDSVNEKAIVG
ncbi:gfo/Idh/MocA family oxidoreductase [Mariniphaga sediminis]|uniref:Gfo/Idh/MocA family oxidoreductase n=1 Tax=Mariniphaga sediminis TaxID=1628158 RepID=A0A399CZ25_9BACT|nr:Gfo/Idh/MocA family oxidoreductase [Mariniphaga sediminis]RIH64466.1 gfo/Idh/MocA family oxidoreductase [Mariniphaga sediminis]